MVGNRKNLRLRSWWSALVPLKSVCGYFTGSWVPALTQERSWEMKLCFLSFPPARMCNLIISTQTRSTSRRLSCLPPQLGDAVRSCIGLQRRLPHEWLWGNLGAWHTRPVLLSLCSGTCFLLKQWTTLSLCTKAWHKVPLLQRSHAPPASKQHSYRIELFQQTPLESIAFL